MSHIHFLHMRKNGPAKRHGRKLGIDSYLLLHRLLLRPTFAASNPILRMRPSRGGLQTRAFDPDG